MGTPDPGEPLHGGGRPAELAEHRAVITTTVVSGLIAVAVAAAEWTGSGRALDTPTGILWSVVALLGVVAMLLGIGLEVRRRRQVEPAVPASGPAGRPGPRLPRPHPAALPTGTVTFLFTDIEGSTRLLQELGDRYAAVRDRHAAIVRQAVEAGGGVEVSTEGDSFFVAFPSPVGAVRAAVAAQRGLADSEWSPASQLRVRMGLHTGEGVLGGDNYVGLDVNRAARIAAAGHGGQVLVSEATRGLVEHALPEGASLRDLGEHRLKDLALPAHLHELVVEGLPADFPPPRTLDARPGNLPVQLTSFVGREQEIAEVRALLEQTRLLTLTGPGGTGKSRLALRVAAELLPAFKDGAFFADLSSVTDPTLVPPVVARALAVPEAAGRSILEARAHYDEALAIERRLGDPARIAEALYNQAFVAGADGDFETAARLFEESRELYRQAGDEAGIARAEWMVVIRDLAAGNWDPPIATAEEAVANWRRTGDRLSLADGLVWTAVVYARAGRLTEARSAVLEALQLFGAADSPIGIVSVILSLAYLARWEERYEDALRLVGTAESLREQVGGRVPLEFLAGFLGDPEAEARAHLSPEAAQRAFQQGRAMSVDAALALAVGRDATTDTPAPGQDPG